jgi:hypothetical protein
MICRTHAASIPRFAVALIICFQDGMAVPWHGRGTASYGRILA